ncbi:MAG: NAD-dependent epimerase/dehydratase family protein [Dehalococcoidia bacterium]|nr:NAD-dependent epimerase/dehydratase family protein [Dehalococcoidia bacterium]
MKSLVTGATGFIGSSIVRELLKDGAEVKVLVRENSDTRNIDGLDIERAYGDIRDKESVKAALKGCDTFFQAAALYANWASDKKLFYDINVEGTRAALTAALEEGVNKVVYTSSIAAVGYRTDGKPADEGIEFNFLREDSPYIWTKHLGELEAKKLYEKGLPLVIVNPAGVIGVRDIKPTPTGELIVKFLKGKMPGYIAAGMNFVDVEDVARGHILASQKGRAGERYILGCENVTIKDFFELVAQAGGMEPLTRKVSYPVAICTAYLCQVISFLTNKPPRVSMSTARNIGKYAYYDCSKAIKELGMPQTPVKTTVEKAVNWFRENGYIGSNPKK